MSDIEQAIEYWESQKRLFPKSFNVVSGYVDLAISALREQQERRAQPENKPLSLDELRQMDGEPVWTVTTGVDGSGRWELCRNYILCASPLKAVLQLICFEDESITDYDYATYEKTWLAYRNKPEAQEND